MNALRRHHAQHDVRSFIIIQINSLNTGLFGLSSGFEFRIEHVFLFEYPVKPFSHGILIAMLVFGHTDLTPSADEHFDIFSAAILLAPVRMVNGAFVSREISKSHSEGLDIAVGPQVFINVVAHHFARECIHDERQVQKTLIGMHVRYVARPDLIGARYPGLFQNIGIGLKLMTAIRRSRIPPATLDQQLVLAKQCDQAVPTNVYPHS